MLTARNLSAWVKENLTVTVMLRDGVSVNDARLLCRDLYHRPYSRNIDYISKQQAQKEQSEAMGQLSFIPAVVGLWAGILFLLLKNRIIVSRCPALINDFIHLTIFIIKLSYRLTC